MSNEGRRSDFGWGENEFLDRHCRASEMGPDKRDGSPHIWFPPFPRRPSSEKVREEKGGRDLDEDFSEKVRERSSEWEEEGAAHSRPSPSCHPDLPGSPILLVPRARRAVTCKTTISTPLLIADPMQIRAVLCI